MRNQLSEIQIIPIKPINGLVAFASITADYYEEKRKEYRDKQKLINDKIAKLHTADEEYYLTAEYILKLATHASELFESSEPQEKRLLLKMSLQNLELDGKNVLSKWIKPFDKIAYYASRQAWLEKWNGFGTKYASCDSHTVQLV